MKHCIINSNKLLILLILFNYSFEQKEIKLVIQGKGEQNLLNNEFYLSPSEIIVNDKTNPSCKGKKTCNLNKNLNEVIIKFGKQINSCQNMFKGLQNIIEIDLSKLSTSKVSDMSSMFYECKNLKKIKFGNIDTSSVLNMHNMFSRCESLTSIDVSKFNTAKVKDMGDMFAYMYKIYAIDLSNFNIGKATDISGMFYESKKLKYLDLSNFDSTSLTSVRALISYCDNLVYLNIKKLKLNSVLLHWTLEFTSPNLKICINDASSRNQLKNKYNDKTYNCGDTCFNKKIKIDLKTNKCITSCDKFDYNNICFDKCPYSYSLINNNNKYLCVDEIPEEGYYLDNTDGIYKQCFTGCKKCEEKGDKINHKCKECINSYMFLNEPNYKKNCFIKCQNYYYFDESNNYKCTEDKICPEKFNKLIIGKNKCIDECKNDNIYKYEYNNNCFEKCPENTYSSTNNLYICLLNTEGYYLDSEDKIYKKCYKTCKSCSGKGDDNNNNCIECKTNYIFIINLNNIKNCYYNCDNYYYFDELNNHKCTENDICPEKYSLIKGKNKCINECKYDNYNKYEFRKICYNDCPQISKKSIEKDYFCEAICDEENPFVRISTQECLKFCDINEILLKTCILRYTFISDLNNINKKILKEAEIKRQDAMIKGIENSFIQEKFDNSYFENFQDKIINYGEITITLTTLKNQKKNINIYNNMTGIDIGKCEDKLREVYHIPKDKILFIKKIDLNQEGFKIPKVVFDLYCNINGTNLIKLNISHCKYTKYNISIPVKLTENIDKLNSSSGYYNDICYTSTTDAGTDIILKDRRNEFIKYKKTLCQDDCIFIDYNYNLEKAICSCNFKETPSTTANMNININELYKAFIDIKNIANIKILVCYKVLFTKNIFRNNLACFIIIPIFIIHIIFIIIFYMRQIKSLVTKIIDIINNLRKRNSTNDKRKKKEKKIVNKKTINKIAKKDLIKNMHSYKKLLRKKNTFLPSTNNHLNKFMKILKSKNNNKNKKFNKTNLKTINNIINIKNVFPIKIVNKSKKKEMINNSLEYTIKELNNLSYELALECDNRKYCQYYISLIKTKHILINSFFYNKDYNSRIIKIDLFFISFIMNYAINALFFNDDTMHKFYIDKGKYDIIYQLPEIAYSTLITTVFGVILNFLALFEDMILDLKNKNKKIYLKNLDNNYIDIIKKLYIKSIFYFIISSLFVLCFWYYLAMFCAIYINTQIHLIKDTLTSFGLSLVYPFFIYLLPGIFRIISLSNKKNKLNCLYNFSKFLQSF